MVWNEALFPALRLPVINPCIT